MKRIPPYRSMNFPVCAGMLDQFTDSTDIEKYYQQGGLNGLEVILAGESDQGKIRPDMVNGVHLFFHIFWMDFWLGDFTRLDEEFDSREQWIEFYGGMDREAYLEPFRRDLEYAEKIGAKYVVFHVSEVTLRESFIYHYKYTNRKVIDAAIEVINTLLSERAYEHEENIDLHRPFLGEGVKELMERIGPEYITFEFKQRSREEYARFIRGQGELLGYIGR